MASTTQQLCIIKSNGIEYTHMRNYHLRMLFLVSFVALFKRKVKRRQKTKQFFESAVQHRDLLNSNIIERRLCMLMGQQEIRARFSTSC